MEKTVASLKQLHSTEEADIKSYYTKKLEESHQELQDVKRAQEIETQNIVQSWSEKMKSQFETQERNHKSAMRNMEHTHNAALTSERTKWKLENDHLKQSVGNLETKTKKIEKQNEVYLNSKLELERSLAETRQALVQKTRELGEKLHALRQVGFTNHKKISLHVYQPAEQRTLFLSPLQYALFQENQSEKALLEKKHQEAIEDLITRHSVQISSMEDDFNAVLSEERIINQQLDEQFLSVKKRFDNRESRPEDIERIVHLETELSAKQEEARKSAERMMQLRNEMLLREDNYNKHFRNGGQAEKVLDVKGAMASTKGITDWLIQSKKRPQLMSGKARARRETD